MGVSSIQKAHGGYDVILADQVLQPEMDGVTMMQKIKDEYPDLEVVMFSGQDPSAGLQAVREGAYRYITKPYSLEELGIIVRQAAEHRWLKQEAVLSKLVEISNVITGRIEKGPKVILREVVETACALINADCAVLYPYDPSEDDFYFDEENVVAYKLEHGLTLTHKPRKAGLAQSIRNSETGMLVVEDINTLDLDFRASKFLSREAIESFVSVALKVTEAALEVDVGVLYLNFRRPHRFSAEELNVIRVFANLVATVIRSARLYERLQNELRTQEELRGRAEELVQIYQEITAKLRQAADSEGVSTLIADRLKKIFGATSCTIRLYDTQAEQFGNVISSHGPSDYTNNPPRSQGTSWYLREYKEPIYAEDIDARLPNDAPVIREEVQQRGTRAVAYFPLLIEETELVGRLAVSWGTRHSFVKEEKMALELFADQAAIAIQNTRLFEEREKRIRDLGALSKISQGLSAPQPLSVNDMARLIHKEASTLMDLTNIYVAQYTKDTNEIAFSFVVEQGKEVKARSGEFAPRVGEQGLMEYVIEQGETVHIRENVQDWCKEHGITPKLPEDPASVAKCWLGAPIKVGDEVFGVIGVQNFETSNVYDTFNEQVLTTAAAQIGIAIVRQRLTEQNKRLGVLQSVSRSISSALDLGESMRRVVEGAMILTDTNLGIIYTIDSEREEIIASYEYPLKSGHLPTRFSEKLGLTWEVYSTGQIVEVEDITSHPKISKKFAQSGMKSSIGIPLKLGDRVVGVLFLNSAQGHISTQEEKKLLTALAEQGAIALEHSRLYDKSQELNMRLALLHTIMSEIISDPTNIERITDLIVENLSQIFKKSSCAIRLYDAESKEFKNLISSRALAMEDYFPPRPDGVSDYVVKKRKPLYIDDTSVEQRGVPNVRPERIKQGVRAAAYLPLISAGELVGRLSIYLHSTYHFTKDDKLFLELAANQSAAAIRNSNLFWAQEQITLDQALALGDLGEVLTDVEQEV